MSAVERAGRRSASRLWPSFAAAALCRWRSHARRDAPAATVSGRHRRRGRSAIEAYPHVWVQIGEVGKLFAALNERGIAEMAIVGAMTRPELADLRLDWGALRRAAGIAQLFRGGDNGLLAGIARSSRAKASAWSARTKLRRACLRPPARSARARRPRRRADIALGARLIAALSPFDAGQGAVVADGRVLAIEAAEGTDAMLARVAELRAGGRLRFKGPGGRARQSAQARTGHAARHAGGRTEDDRGREARNSGVALAAGRVLIARSRPAPAADAAGLFVVGLASVSAAG